MQLTGRAESGVRAATAADAADLARIQRTTWRTAYRSLLPADVLDTWDDAAVTAAWASAITAAPSADHGVLVAHEGELIVGYLAHGPADDPGPRAAAEVSAFLVEPRWGRRGHGSRLMAALVDVLVPRGVGEVAQWVAEADRVTAGFLESAGWAADTWSRTLDAGSTTIRERRWHVLLPDHEGLG